ncbi:hypothetical protein [Prevotella amnii]|uniref:hypothetical protein n=1 Tax=Prevotella amnii TaxID=419005 RepID=UPI0006895DFC|nr:hypothetical protein [Prevotella amnii]
MKKIFLLLAVVGFIFFTACSSQDEIIKEHNKNSSTINVQASLCKSNPEYIKGLFSFYAVGTRSMGVPNKINNFNFDKAVTTYSQTKDFYIYMVPIKGENTLDSLLVGVGQSDRVVLQLYLGKNKKTGIYTLYNESNEPIYDINYNTTENTLSVINLYGNDATILPPPETRAKKRAMHRHTWSVICNTAIVAVGATVGFLGLVPTAGASGIGMAVCTGLLSAVAC